MVKVSEISAFAAHRGRGRARFDSPARPARRGGRAERHAQTRRPARPSSQAAPWTVEEWCGDAASRRFPLGKPPRGTEFCLQPLAVGFGTPSVCRPQWQTVIKRKKNVPANFPDRSNALQRLHRLAGDWSLRRTRARWWSSDAPCRTLPRDSRVSEPSLGTPRVGRSSARADRGFISGREIPQFAAFERARGFAASHGVQGSWAPREDAQAAFARRIHTKQKGALVAWGIPSSLHAPWRSALVRRSGGTRW